MARLLLFAVLLVAVVGGIAALILFLGSLRSRLRTLPPPDTATLDRLARGDGRGAGAEALAPPLALPGWYADPAGSARQRWWDGRAWTDDFRSPPA